MPRKGARLARWEPQKVVDHVMGAQVSKAFGKFGLVVEGYSKKELRKGHGVLTGTLRRSIHTAQPGYNWGQDDVENGPERGGQGAVAQVVFGKASLLIGSGLNYALPVHQGHHNFSGYHFLTLALDKAKPELPKILAEFKDK